MEETRKEEILARSKRENRNGDERERSIRIQGESFSLIFILLMGCLLYTSKNVAMITVCGRPNVGKSSLTNTLVGEKVAIVSNKAQTTRNRIYGVVNREDTQYILMDRCV